MCLFDAKLRMVNLTEQRWRRAPAWDIVRIIVTRSINLGKAMSAKKLRNRGRGRTYAMV